MRLVYQYLGYSAWILLLIPLVLLVRLLFRRSRWSVIRMALTALLGVFSVSLWLSYAERMAGTDSALLGGRLGLYLAGLLESWTGNPLRAFLIATGLIFLWALVACMDFIIATARFFIHKPPVRETKVPKREKKAEANPRQEKKAVDALPDYKMPASALLKGGSSGHHQVSRSEMESNIAVIRETLADHHVKVADIDAIPGPTVTLYKVYPAKGVKVSAIRNLADDVSVALKAGKVMSSIMTDCVGLEVANRQRSAVSAREMMESEAFRESTAALPVAIGRKVTGEVKVFDLADAPHLLVAGATGQGKSVGLNTLVASLLYSKRPSELKLVFIDPKKTEFGRYARLHSHYLALLPDAGSEADEKAHAIVKEPKDADRILRSLCEEMSQRYDLLEMAGTPEIKEYNAKYSAHKLNPQKGHRYLPYIVAIIDEYAQLVLGTGGPDAKAHSRGIMTSIISLAQMGRACGIHLVIATQTPRREVISGLIKANFPMSIAFKTKTDMDSRVILDQTGAEKLLGKGDMLISKNASTERVQCAFISSGELDALMQAVEMQKGYRKSFNTPYYLPEVKDDGGDGGEPTDMGRVDARFEEAARRIVTSQRASTTDLQRHLGMGYARAGKVMDQLEAAGIVGPLNGSKPREVLVQSLADLEEILERVGGA